MRYRRVEMVASPDICARGKAHSEYPLLYDQQGASADADNDQER